MDFGIDGIRSIDRIRKLFARHGVSVIYFKQLAKKGDNSKNQIYLGRGLKAVCNLLPLNIQERQISRSKSKTSSKPGSPIMESPLDFSWMTRSGELHHV